MARLNGLTKDAKLASGRSYACDKCSIKYLCHCNEEILKACNRAFVEGFKKGAKFYKDESSRTEKEAIAMFNEDYGMNLNTRLRKLAEETGELNQAINGYRSGQNGIWAIKDEMSDVLAVITHVSSLLGTDPRELFENALEKIRKRKKDPNYKRLHPHIGD